MEITGQEEKVEMEGQVRGILLVDIQTQAVKAKVKGKVMVPQVKVLGRMELMAIEDQVGMAQARLADILHNWRRPYSVLPSRSI